MLRKCNPLETNHLRLSDWKPIGCVSISALAWAYL